MKNGLRVGIAAVLTGCLVISPGLFAERAGSEEPGTEPVSHASPLGTLALTSGDDNVNLRFRSASSRTFDLTLDKRTGVWTIEGLRFRAHSGRLRVRYGDQVADAALDSEGKMNDADVASVTALLSVWREETGIAPDLAAAQIAMHEMMASDARRRPLDACTWAIIRLAGVALGLPAACVGGPILCGAALLIFIAAEGSMGEACGITGCYPVTGFEQC